MDTFTRDHAERRYRAYLEEESRRAGFTLVGTPEADEHLHFTVALRSPQGRIISMVGKLGDILTAMDAVTREERQAGGE